LKAEFYFFPASMMCLYLEDVSDTGQIYFFKTQLCHEPRELLLVVTHCRTNSDHNFVVLYQVYKGQKPRLAEASEFNTD